VRRSFWLLYNPLAWAYDWVSQVVSLGYWHEWQRAALGPLRGQRVLELACGTGDVLIDLVGEGRQPVGLDLSRTMLRVTRRKLSRHRIDVPLVRGRGQALPFASQAYDALVCTFPSDFILSRRTRAEIARVLKPGGMAVVVLMAHLFDRGPLYRGLEWLYRITGQRATISDLPDRLAEAGLTGRIVHVPVSQATVTMALVEKTS